MPVTDEKGLFVLGYLFSEERDRVVLIRKDHPEWQAGRLNGLGGHVNYGEHFGDAMAREFREECGLDVRTWEFFATLVHRNWEVACYRAFAPAMLLLAAKSTTREPVGVYEIEHLTKMHTVPNVPWMCALALCEEQPGEVRVRYK